MCLLIFVEWLATGQLGEHWTKHGVEGFVNRQRIFGSCCKQPLRHPDDLRTDHDITEAPGPEPPLCPDITTLLLIADGCKGQFHGRHSFIWIQVRRCSVSACSSSLYSPPDGFVSCTCRNSFKRSSATSRLRSSNRLCSSATLPTMANLKLTRQETWKAVVA